MSYRRVRPRVEDSLTNSCLAIVTDDAPHTAWGFPYTFLHRPTCRTSMSASGSKCFWFKYGQHLRPSTKIKFMISIFWLSSLCFASQGACRFLGLNYFVGATHLTDVGYLSLYLPHIIAYTKNLSSIFNFVFLFT